MTTAPEERIAAAVVSWCHARGLPTWHEVVIEPGGPRLDICAQYQDSDGHACWAIECKARMSLALIAQAQPWTRYASRVSVAVGIDAAHPRVSDSAQCVLDALGIGLIVVNSAGSVLDVTDSDYVTHGALYEDDLRAALRPEQQTTPAGNARADYLTPEQQTLSRLVEIVRYTPGITFTCAATQLGRGHYCNTYRATQALRRALRKGVDGVRYERSVSNGKARVRLWPAEKTF